MVKRKVNKSKTDPRFMQMFEFTGKDIKIVIMTVLCMFK